MRFRTPELFLGALLAVAIFSMGLLFASSFALQVQNATPQQTAQHQTTNKIGDNGDGAQSLWVPTDSVGLYTLVLAAFTALLVGVSGVQGYFLLRADKTARIAANAADLSARAAIALELPIIRMTPQQFGFGVRQEVGVRTEYCHLHSMTHTNVGRSKAFPIDLACGWTFGDELPAEPVYIFTKTFRLNFIAEPNEQETEIVDVTMDLPANGYGQIRDGTTKMWFYCRFAYLDFMQTRHESSFCWSRFEGIGGGRFIVDASPAYNRKT